MARDLKIWIDEVDGLYFPCSENKGADQLRGYREADLRLCFRIYAKSRFSHDAAQIKGFRKCGHYVWITLASTTQIRTTVA